jgi:hypothetical protein
MSLLSPGGSGPGIGSAIERALHAGAPDPDPHRFHARFVRFVIAGVTADLTRIDPTPGIGIRRLRVARRRRRRESSNDGQRGNCKLVEWHGRALSIDDTGNAAARLGRHRDTPDSDSSSRRPPTLLPCTALAWRSSNSSECPWCRAWRRWDRNMAIARMQSAVFPQQRRRERVQRSLVSWSASPGKNCDSPFFDSPVARHIRPQRRNYESRVPNRASDVRKRHRRGNTGFESSRPRCRRASSCTADSS